MTRSRTRFALALATLAGLAAVGCGGAEDAAETAVAEVAKSASATNQAPVIEQVELLPGEVEPAGQLEALVDARDPEGHEVKLGFVWMLGDYRLPGGESTIEVPRTARRGDVVRVSVTATDSATTSEASVASAVVANSRPQWRELSLDAEGEVLAGTEIAIVAIADDRDGDELEFETIWYVNGEETDAMETRLPTGDLRRGDVVQAIVVASDGDLETDERETNEVRIGNAEPTIVSSPGTLSKEGRFDYAVVVEDPDGDRRFEYSLNSAPPGMEIDSSFGEVTWQADESHVGTHAVEVVVADHFGGEARQRFDLTVRVRTEDAVPAKIEE